jgi:hypothetical protein
VSRHLGLLGAVERVEEAGEGLGVGREIFRPAKVPGHYSHHIGLAAVVPFFGPPGSPRPEASSGPIRGKTGKHGGRKDEG